MTSHMIKWNKPGTAQVGTISKAQKIEGGAFGNKKKSLKSRTVPKKLERGDLLLSSGSVGYVKKVKSQRGPFGDKKISKKVAQCRKKLEGGTLQSRPVLYDTFKK